MRWNMAGELKSLMIRGCGKIEEDDYMTRQEHEYLWELINNPPPGSKIEAARKHGIDLTLDLRRLTLTPTERAQEMQAALQFLEDLRQAKRIDD